MSVVGGILSPMDISHLYVAIAALLLGAVLGLLWGKSRTSQPGNSSEADLADSRARAEMLTTQVNELKAEIQTRNEREKAAAERESKILQELAPVKDNIDKMQTKVAEMERERNTQFGAIQKQLEEAQAQNLVLATNTSALKSALSNNQARGKWGEVSLRKLLESAGMMPHVHFIEQSNLNNSNGDAIKPDCLILYPNKKFVPVDSKFPFQDFDRAISIPEVASQDDERERKKHMKAHVDAVKKHIDAISGKSYYTAIDMVKDLASAPEFTILFVANDGVLAATLAEDPTVLEYAFAHQVALVSPNSLFGVLRTIQHIWTVSGQEEMVHDIIRVGKDIYSRLRVVAEHATKVGDSLDSAIKAYNKMVSSMERNLLTSTRELNKQSNKLLEDNKPLEVLEELDNSTDSFTKPEFTEGKAIED